MLPADPSFDDVKKLVLTENRRPLVPTVWYKNEVRCKARTVLEQVFRTRNCHCSIYTAFRESLEGL